MPRSHDVFLSYSHADTELMRKLRNTLVMSGITVWSDETIEPGTSSWTTAIDTALREAGCPAVILTPSSAASWWVQEELNFARLQEKRVFPILALGDEKVSVPFGLAGVQWIDIRKEADYSPKLDQLIDAVREHLKISSGSNKEISRQQKQQDTLITHKIYQQLREYRRQVLALEIDNAAKNRDALAAHIAKLEAERDFRVMDIDFELNHSNPTYTREYFLKWLRILEFYWHEHQLAVGNIDAMAAVKAKSEARIELNNLSKNLLEVNTAIDPIELSDNFYIETVKYLRKYGEISQDGIQNHLLLNSIWATHLIDKLNVDHLIGIPEENGVYKAL